jgi:nucleoside-diphosphate-sugar epimerase
MRVLEAPLEKVRGKVFNVGSNEHNVRILNLAQRIRDLVPGTEIELIPTDIDVRDYNVNFDRIQSELGWKPEMSIEAGAAEILQALKTGALDPDDRRWFTIRHYRFLAEVEQTYRDLAMDDWVLS